MKNPSRRAFLIIAGLGSGSYVLKRVLMGGGIFLTRTDTAYSEGYQMGGDREGSLVPVSEAAPCVNISGLEWNSVTSRSAGMHFNLTGSLSVTQDAYFKYLSTIGIKKVRLAVMWEAIQPVLYDCPYTTGGVSPFVTAPGMLHSEVVAIIQRNLASCANYGMRLILDIHNYGSYLDLNYQNGGTWSGSITTPWYKAYTGAIAKGTATFSADSNQCTLDSGTLAVGQPMIFTPEAGASLPPEIITGTVYYVVSASGTSISLSATHSGSAITYSESSSGTINRSQPAGTISKSFKNGLLSAAHMADLFTRLVAAFDSHSALEGYGLMNEVGISGGISETAWTTIANTSIAAIRTAKSTKKIFIDGPYTNASTNPYNASMLGSINDPADNYAREVHWYLDANRSGSYFDWGYDQERGFCVDVAGAKGNIPQIGAVRGKSLETISRLLVKPVFVGELGIPHTHDMYYAIAKDFIKAARSLKSDVCLWGASQNLYFPPALLIRPYVKNGTLLPSPPVSAILNDAGVEDAKIVSYIDVKNSSITIEAYGSLTSPVTISISDNGAGTTLSANSVELKPGVLSSATINYTVADNKDRVAFSFNSSRAAITPPPGATVLTSKAAGSGSITLGQLALQNSRASIFFAGTGMATMGGGVPISTEALVPDAGLSDDRFALNNLIASPNGMVAVSAGLNGKPAWNSGRKLNPGEYKTDFLISIYTKPSTNPGHGSYTGANPPHKAVFTTKSTSWFIVCSFDRQAAAMSGQICGLYHLGKNYGICISGNNTTLRLGKLDNTGVSYVNNDSPTTIPDNTKVTCIITNVNGLSTLYINGHEEASYTFMAEDTVLDNFGVLGGICSYYPVTTASANIRVYSAAIGYGGLSEAEINGITAYFNQ